MKTNTEISAFHNFEKKWKGDFLDTTHALGIGMDIEAEKENSDKCVQW